MTSTTQHTATTHTATPHRMEREISASLLRLRVASPFFATLAMHASFKPNHEIQTAATDGTDVHYNPAFLGSLPSEQLDGVLLHEVLHAALDHVHRRGSRDPQAWNIAADIVVNGLLDANGFELPDGAVRDSDLSGFSVEEVYALLPEREERYDLNEIDLIESPDAGDPKDGNGRGMGGSAIDDAAQRAREKHWKTATAKATAIGRGATQGKLPLGVERAFGLIDAPMLDWRTVLWRFLTPTPTDFASFDRRFIHTGMYLETLDDVSLRVVVAVDTSGSIDEAQINDFLGEVEGVLRAYPGIECWLFYADAAAYGPYRIEPGGELPPPEGGGGTDFRPVFSAAEELNLEHAVCVYLTDGFGDFPDPAPDYPVLWVVLPGGLDDEQFPFGTVIRLANE